MRDGSHRLNEKCPAGRIKGKAPGPIPKLSAEQKQELKRIVEIGPDLARDGVVRWRCVDLRRVIKGRFDVDLDGYRLAVSSRNSALPMSARVPSIPSTQ